MTALFVLLPRLLGKAQAGFVVLGYNDAIKGKEAMNMKKINQLLCLAAFIVITLVVWRNERKKAAEYELVNG